MSASAGCPMIKVRVGIEKVGSTWLVDSGARESVMDSETFKEKFPEISLEPLPPTIRFFTADGSPLNVRGSFWTQFWFGGMKDPIRARIYVCMGVTRTRLIGVNILSQFPCWGVDNIGKCFTVGDIRIPLELTVGEAPSASVVQLVTDIKVPSRCSRIVAASLPHRYLPTEFIFQPSERIFGRHKLLVPTCLVANNFFDSTVAVRVTNVSDSEVTVHKGTKLGRVLNNVKDYDILPGSEGDEGRGVCVIQQAGKTQEELLKDLEETHPELFKLYKESCGKLSEGEKQQLLTMLAKHRHVFSVDDYDIGQTDVVTHKIIPKSNKVIYRRQYRHTEEQHQQIDKEVQRLLEMGVIKESMSPFNNPVLLVPKKEAGKWRFCLDCRYINDLTADQYFPIPRVDECLDSLSGMTVYSSGDCIEGYHQVDLDPETSEMCAFSTRKGHYQYARLPMGLRGSGMTFQKLVTLLLSGMLHSEVLAYLDDLIIFSKTVQEHFGILDEVLRRFGEANLKLKPRKCRFFQEQILYLGFLIDKDGIRPDPARTKLISELREPTNVTGVQMFLGKVNYYRKFIPKLAEIAHPLYELTKCKGGRSFVWEPEHQAAFDQLKSILVSGQVMGHPKLDRQLVLDVDASDFALGAELSQEDDQGNLRPIYYASRHLEKSERNYSATARETLAAVFGCEYFRQYLQGRKFLLRTDHNPLVWLRGMREPKRPYSGWIVRLEQFDYQMQYRPGKEHVNADFNSRIQPQGGLDGTGLVSVGTQTDNVQDKPVTLVEAVDDYSRTGEVGQSEVGQNENSDTSTSSECYSTPVVDSCSGPGEVQQSEHSDTSTSSECYSTPVSRSEDVAPGMRVQNVVASDCDSTPVQSSGNELLEVQTANSTASECVSTPLQRQRVASIGKISATNCVDTQLVVDEEVGPTTENLKGQQMADKDIGPVLQRLQGLGGETVLTRAGEQLWRVRKNLQVKDGVLIRLHKLKAGLRAIEQIVLPACFRELALDSLHDSAFAGHFGEKRTLARLKLRYYWPGYVEDVSDWCRTCDVCQKRKNPKTRNVAPLTPIDPGKGPFEQVALDILELPVTERGNRYLLVIEDFFSKWVEAFPLVRTVAPSVAQCMLNGWIARFGCPYTILTDQGTEFTSKLFKALSDTLQSKKLRTTTYHPRTDGMVERSNRTIIDVLSKYGNSEPNWDLQLPLALFAIRTSEHATTGFSPFCLTYGREARIPWDIVYGSAPHTLMPLEKWVADRKQHMTQVFKMVQEQTKQRQLQQKRYFDSNLKGEFQRFEKEELVMIYDAAARSKVGKLNSPWSGPYPVVDKLSDCLYKVLMEEGKEKVVNVEKLKKYYERGKGVVVARPAQEVPQQYPREEETESEDEELPSDGEEGDQDVIGPPLIQNQGDQHNGGANNNLVEPLMGARGQYWCNLDPRNIVGGGRRNQ